MCVPIKDRDQRLPSEVACTRVNTVTLFNLCVEIIKPVLVRGTKIVMYAVIVANYTNTAMNMTWYNYVYAIDMPL